MLQPLVSMLVPDGRMLLPQGLCTAMLWLSTVPLCLLLHSLPPSLVVSPKHHLDEGTPIDHVHAPPIFCLTLPPRYWTVEQFISFLCFAYGTD